MGLGAAWNKKSTQICFFFEKSQALKCTTDACEITQCIENDKMQGW